MPKVGCVLHTVIQEFGRVFFKVHVCITQGGGTEHMDTESDVLTWVANDSHDSNTATSLVMCICSCRSCCAVSVSVWINSSGSPLRARDPTHGNVTHVTSTTHLVPPGGLMTKF